MVVMITLRAFCANSFDDDFDVLDNMIRNFPSLSDRIKHQDHVEGAQRDHQPSAGRLPCEGGGGALQVQEVPEEPLSV